jgi:peptidoglycan lytic transglycosylase G
MNDRLNRNGLRSPHGLITPMAPPEPPVYSRRGGRFLQFLSGLLTFILFVAVGAGLMLYMVQRQFGQAGPLPTDKVVTVKGGSQAVAAILEREGVISQPTLFVIAVQVSGAKDNIKAGEYLFKQRASLNEVIDTLVSGKSVLHSVTIPEGLTSEQIVARLKDSEVLAGEIAAIPGEGTLLPDTYKVPRGLLRQELIERMVKDQERILSEIWARRATGLPVKTPEEFVILASIVEKETGRADERPRVAGVFINRLQRKMKLQSDPTIVYGIVGGKGTLGRGILRSEIDKPTPYNTYVIDGLPPGPIANPGRAALEAVANPSRTKDVYFVADGTGGHVFAETLDQHQRNVVKWRQVEASRRADRVDQIEAGVVPGAGQATRGTGQNAPAFAPADQSRNNDGIDELNQAAKQKGGASAAAGEVQPPRRPRAFDASEGTKRDPLANKTFDLNSPKIVPSLK